MTHEILKGLRSWQTECLTKIAETTGTRFAITAGVGSGKTRAALATYVQGGYDTLIVMSHTRGIVGSWEKDATEGGINLTTLDDYDGTQDGLVTTPQALLTKINQAKLIADNGKTLLVVDEAHHYTEDKAWGKAVLELEKHCSFLVALTATPTRFDKSRIAFLDYVEGSNDKLTAVSSFDVPYAYALKNEWVGPTVSFLVGGSITQINNDTGETTTFDFDDDFEGMDNPDSMRGQRLKLATSNDSGYRSGFIDFTLSKLDKLPAWSGALFAVDTIEQAKEVHKELGSKGYKSMLVVAAADTSDCVKEFNKDETYRCLVSITKVAEGISVPRLRCVGYLSVKTSPVYFEQLRGRLVRKMDGVPFDQQLGYFVIPKDSALSGLASLGNETVFHTLKEKGDTPETVELMAELDESGETEVNIGNFTYEGSADGISILRGGQAVCYDTVKGQMAKLSELTGKDEATFYSLHDYMIEPFTQVAQFYYDNPEGTPEELHEAIGSTFCKGYTLKKEFKAIWIKIGACSPLNTLAYILATIGKDVPLFKLTAFGHLPNGYWKDQPTRLAHMLELMPTNLSDWQKRGGSSCSASKRLGKAQEDWKLYLKALKDTSHIKEPQKPNGYWTDQPTRLAHMLEAMPSKIKDWKERGGSSYNASQTLGKIQEDWAVYQEAVANLNKSKAA